MRECTEIGMGFISALEEEASVWRMQTPSRRPRWVACGCAAKLRGWAEWLHGQLQVGPGRMGLALGLEGLALAGHCLPERLPSAAGWISRTQISPALPPQTQEVFLDQSDLGDCTESCACHLIGRGPGELELSHKATLRLTPTAAETTERRGGSGSGSNGHPWL